MVDNLSIEQRHKNMVAIKSKNTKPEIIVRKISHNLGLRFKLHDAKLLGKPDLVFPKHKKIIFVHGCFWHSHNCKSGKVVPKTNTKYWQDKRERNKKRYLTVKKSLKILNWKILVIWECQTKNNDIVQEKLTKFFM